MPPMVYDQPTVGPQSQSPVPTSAPRFQVDPGQASKEAGAVMSKASEMAIRIQDDIDNAAAKHASNALQDFIRKINYDAKTGYLHSAGKDALEGREPTSAAIERQIENIGGSLQTNMQRRMFQQVANAQRETALKQIDSHAAQQTRVYHTAEANARVQGAIQDAVLYYDRGDIGAYEDCKNLIRYEADQLLELSGVRSGDEQANRLKEAAISDLHVKVVDQLLTRENPHDADNYFKANKDGVDRKIRPQVTNTIQNAVDKYEGTLYGRAVWEGSKGHPLKGKSKWRNGGQEQWGVDERLNINWIPPEDRMFAAIRGSNRNEAQKRIATNELQQNLSRWKADKQVRQSQEVSSIYDMYLLDLTTRSDRGSVQGVRDPGVGYAAIVDKIDGSLDLTQESKLRVLAWADKAYGVDAKVRIEGQAANEKEALLKEAEMLGVVEDLKSGQYVSPLKDYVETYYGDMGKDLTKRLLSEVAKERTRRIAENAGDLEKAKEANYQIASLGNYLQFQEDFIAGRLASKIKKPQDAASLAHQLGEYTDDAMKFVRLSQEAGADTNITMEKLKDTLRMMKFYPAPGTEDMTFPETEYLKAEQKAQLSLLREWVVDFKAAAKRGGRSMSDEEAIATALKPLTAKGSKDWFSGQKARYTVEAMRADELKKQPIMTQQEVLASRFYREKGRMPTGAEVTLLYNALHEKD